MSTAASATSSDGQTDLERFERYREIVGDPAAFAAAVARPLPICVWTHEARTTPERLLGWMEIGGSSPRPLPWYEGAFRLEDTSDSFRPGNRLEFLTGLYNVQEEVSLLPPALLEPRPGDRVLDLCAAPGNKTAQLSLRVGPTGTVVANDRHFSRISILRRTLDRLGLTNCATTIYDAANYPKAAGLFDRVLADVPCSCEGTSRKFRGIGRSEASTKGAAGRLARMQAAILRRAVELTRPGGRIVYSTCTYAPEENEAVVASALEEWGPRTLRPLPARVEGFAADPGLTAWQGRAFPKDLALAMRAWPHRNDSGGFFVAVLEKVAATEVDAPEGHVQPPKIVPPEERGAWLDPVIERFALPPDAFDDFELLGPSSKYLWIVDRGLRLPRRPEAHGVGIPLLRTDMRTPKLASGAAFRFGALARRNFVALDREQTDAFAHRQRVRISAEQAGATTGRGFVLLRHEEVTLGVGHLKEEDGEIHVESYFPRAWALAPERSLFDGVG